MEFSPFNPVIKLCLQGMNFEDKGMSEEADRLFLQAWEESSNDHEKFLAAHYVSRHQKMAADRLKWLEISLEFALKINDDTVKSALPSLYQNISKGYNDVGDTEKSKKNAELALLLKNHPSDKGPFYHGTKADLHIGDLLTAGGNSNYKSELKMNHIYFTALTHGAGLAAALAKGDGTERVYRVEPTGNFENDPNVTDKKFPGNPTRSYRSEMPLKIIGEITEWVKPSSEDLQKFREKLDNSKGEILN
ncbi:NAD(+)--rifampin ADP-ribosyltransferase [Chryseobacterium viscerum]|uniref:NAD(+)--rifampin ADP-ribosyltransferase n=1 Tax=Chryseobacterium viscerum TaxID=1037377 RepID=A0A316WDE1_9FLAO|nr:NAD(+)--rifampin ADP-ribosyltransferase [Chryseobacterium viscerum]PWN59444.1 NAD(+)--rifampin ADP-ribosyltransferase [Chryseobacterium viscerum]